MGPVCPLVLAAGELAGWPDSDVAALLRRRATLIDSGLAAGFAGRQALRELREIRRGRRCGPECVRLEAAR